jgi:tRNA modification GTPase
VTADTIFALSSGSPPAAIAVVRISGPKADWALQALAGTLPEARRAGLAPLRSDGEPLDEAIVLRFPGPHSATGEDVVELHLHGGRAVVAGVQAALARMAGLRAAEPGEFTRRAFENGRIDLTEAEGLADLLEAETETQRRSALALAGGALGRQAAAWKQRLLGLGAEIEAALDFSDEDDVTPLAGDFTARLAALRGELRAWLARPPAERLKDGVRAVVLGPPNAGKSTLINALAQRDAAITSPLPGTTRDLVEVPVAICGVPFLLVDTAGLRDPAGEIEAIGIERARASAAVADLLMWLGPLAEAPAGAILIRPKADLDNGDGDVGLAVSALTGQGMDSLVQALVDRAAGLLPAAGEVALNARHRAALAAAAEALDEASGTGDLLLVAEALRRGRVALDRVMGAAGVEDMLDALFGRFCIGK